MKTENKLTLLVILLFASLVLGFFYISVPLALISSGCVMTISILGIVFLGKKMAK